MEVNIRVLGSERNTLCVIMYKQLVLSALPLLWLQ